MEKSDIGLEPDVHHNLAVRDFNDPEDAHE
jgi:hypothetical protein